MPCSMSCSSGPASGRVQLDRAGVVDDAGERQDRAVADHHVAGILRDRRLIEHEVARGERSGIDPVQRDRLAIGERDHRVAGSVVGHMRLDVAEAGEVGIADQIDLIRGSVEAIDHVMPDRLREHEQVVAARAGQVVVARPARRSASLVHKTSTLSK